MDAPDEAVSRNRAANPRRTPGRAPLGDHVVVKLYLVTTGAIVAATVALVVLLAS